MFQQMIYFVKPFLSSRDGLARMEGKIFVDSHWVARCLITQLWLVWMTGSFVSPLSSSFIFIFFVAFSRDLSGKWQL